MPAQMAAAQQQAPLSDEAGPPIDPAYIQDGLAIYDHGHGEPVLLMPYPHGFTQGPAAAGPLARMLAALGRRVLTFDPPGAYGSTRPAQIGMPEMLACALETLATCGVAGAVDIVGHSMGGLCALAFALEHPDRVRRLVLIGTVSGGPAVTRYRGMPLNWLPIDPRFWRFVLPALRIRRGHGTLADHKRVQRMMESASVVDKRTRSPIRILPGDERRPAPIRDRWPAAAAHLDYRSRLGQVQAPTLVCVGRHDPQAPDGCSEELARGIPGARLVVFGHSGHRPWVEEPQRFTAVLGAFLTGSAPPPAYPTRPPG